MLFAACVLDHLFLLYFFEQRDGEQRFRSEGVEEEGVDYWAGKSCRAQYNGQLFPPFADFCQLSLVFKDILQEKL